MPAAPMFIPHGYAPPAYLFHQPPPHQAHMAAMAAYGHGAAASYIDHMGLPPRQQQMLSGAGSQPQQFHQAPQQLYHLDDPSIAAAAAAATVSSQIEEGRMYKFWEKQTQEVRGISLPRPPSPLLECLAALAPPAARFP